MSVKYNNSDELRYIKYQNLLEESRIVANYFRDQIHAYGMDCTYYKSTVNLPPEFSKVLTSNDLLRQAYGYDDEIKFELTADLITYTEVETDIFTLDRIGHQNDQKTYFYFDLTEFATAFMAKLGQFKEYPFYSQTISGEVKNGKIEFTSDFNSDILSGTAYCSHYVELDGGYASTADNEYDEPEIDMGANGAKPSNIYRPVFSGGRAGIDTPMTGIAHCLVTSHSTPMFSMPVNEYIARSFNYSAKDGELAFISYFKYTLFPDGTYVGKLDGTILYYDLNLVSKYAGKIRPNVGDIISLHTSFGDITYEVNDVEDQNMTTDGINPLVYKYIWKISASRRIDSHESTAPEDIGSKQSKELLKNENLTRAQTNMEIEPFEDNQDLVYGGFKGTALTDEADDQESQEIVWDASELYIGSYMNIMQFGNGCELMTDGLNLFFKNAEDKITKLSLYEPKLSEDETVNRLPVSLRYLKADTKNIYFQNVDGNIQTLIGESSKIDPSLREQEIEDYEENKDGMNFFKFPSCRTVIFSSPYCLYAKLEASNEYYRLA